MSRRSRPRTPQTKRKFEDLRWAWAKLWWSRQGGPLIVRAVSAKQAYQLIWLDQVYIFDQSVGQFRPTHLAVKPSEIYRIYSRFLDECTPRHQIEWFSTLAEADASMRQPSTTISNGDETGDEQLTLVEVVPSYRSPYDSGH